jgi:hypothetical protein
MASGATGAAAVAIALFPAYEREYEQRRYDEWRLQIQGFNQQTDAWEWLAAETDGAKATIAVAGTNEVYPLYGPNLDNRIVTIWSGGELARYSWNTRFVLYGEPDQNAWLRQLEDSGVDYVVLTANVSFGGWPVERAWMRASPERFVRDFQNEDIEIWTVFETPGAFGVILVGKSGSFDSIGAQVDQHC